MTGTMALSRADAYFLVLLGCMLKGAVALSPSAPDQVSAVAGYCAVIPCSFGAVRPERGGAGQVQVRLRFQARPFGFRDTAFSTQNSVEWHRNFRGRIALIGNLSDGDCSLSVTRVRATDAKFYELQLREPGETEWGKVKAVQLTVTDMLTERPVISDPGPVLEGQRVVLNCSVELGCPTQPPHVQWSWERGAPDGGSPSTTEEEIRQSPGQRHTLISSLSFNASTLVKPRLKCEVFYPSRVVVGAVKELHVLFPPKDVSIQVHTLSVRERGNALLSCSCKADPPAFEYRWSFTQSGDTVTLPQRSHTLRIFNVTRDMRVLCTAHNKLGYTRSPPTALNVQYKPLIARLSSACVWERGVLACHCQVDSNPRPAITWSVNGSQPPQGYNSSVSSVSPGNSNIFLATLQGPAMAPPEVVCYAVNALGNDSHTLLKSADGTDYPTALIVLGCAALSVLLLGSLLCCCCCCRRRKTRASVIGCRQPAVYPEDMGIYQEHMPLYINCSEVTNIYTNGSYQLVYQNCTPLFVRTKQINKRQRRGGMRERAPRLAERERAPRLAERPIPPPTDPDTAVYLEIL